MKFRLLFTLMLCSLFSIAQQSTPMGHKNRLYDLAGPMRFNQGAILGAPQAASNYPDISIEGGIAYDNSAKGIVYYDGTAWQTVGNQFSEVQRTALLQLIYQNHTAVLGANPSSGERGLATPVNISCSITPGSDVFTAATINNGIGAVTWGNGAQNYSAGSLTGQTTFTLTKNFTRNGTPTTQTQTTSYTAHVPQWSGNSAASDFTGAQYNAINTTAGFTKTISANSTLNRAFTAGSKAWFITTSGNGTITGNGFTYTIGAWGDNTAFFWRKALTLTLADGTTTATVYLIRSREDLTANITFIHS